MVNNYYQKHKDRLRKKEVKDIKVVLKKKKIKDENSSRDIKVLLKKKKKKDINVTWHVKRSYLNLCLILSQAAHFPSTDSKYLQQLLKEEKRYKDV